MAAVLYLVLRPRRGTVTSAVGEIRFLLIVVVALVAAYSFYVFGVFFFMRYLYPVYFIACVYVALLVESLFVRLGRQARFARSVVAIGLVLYAAGFAYMAYSSAFRSTQVYYFYDVAQWLSEHTDPDDKIGVFQGGAVGYLSDRDVVNLDGKVNRHALDALRNHTLTGYLEQEGFDVIVDNSNVLDLLLFGPENGDPRRDLTLEKIMHGASDGIPGWSAYRIHGPGAGSGAAPGTPPGSSQD